MACYIRAELMFAQVAHTGRSMHKPKEIDRIEQLDEPRLESNYIINKNKTSEEGFIDGNRILVIAPYNDQANKLEGRPTGRANVGTVDQFQGQEATEFIVLMTASCEGITPKGINFLVDKSRLKVDISKAKCLDRIISIKERLNCPPSSINESKSFARINSIKRSSTGSV